MALKFYTSVTKGLKQKLTKFRGLIPKFVEVTEEKLVGDGFTHHDQPDRLHQTLLNISIFVLVNVYI